MPHTSHPRPAFAPSPLRRAVRLALLAATGLGVLGAATGTAAAARGIAIQDDVIHTLANPGHHDQFRDSFTVHQEGAVYAASLRNQATAESAYCSADDPCRSVAVSFQIVTLAGTRIRLNAANVSRAVNVHCPGCQTLAGAYQFIVSTPRPFALDAGTRQRLDTVRRELDGLAGSGEPVSEVQHEVDALAAQVTDILGRAAAAAPRGPGIDALSQAAPRITVHRMLHAG